MSSIKLFAALLILSLWGAVAHAGKVTYVYSDPQGTPLAEADASGNITARFDYTPYGESVPSMGAAPNGVGYTGHVNDPETGLVYMQARYYDPSTGRFLSVDPVLAYSTPSASFNRYWYASNNPYRFLDLDGRQAATSQSCGEQPCPAPPQPSTTPLPSPSVDPATIPRRIVGTVEGATSQEAAKAAQKKIRVLQRRVDQEYCGTICPAPNSNTFIVVITTNDAVTACYAEPCAGSQQGDNPSIHNHPVGPARLTRADQVLTNGQRPAGQLFVPNSRPPGFSGADYDTGSGYLVLGNRLYYQDGVGTGQEVKP